MSLPEWMNNNRRVIRTMPNEFDKSTVVNISPLHLKEVKETMQPGKFELEPGTVEQPSILVVGPSAWFLERDENAPMVEVMVSSVQVADSIVIDYCNGIMESDMNSKMPGLFWVPGKLTVSEIKKQHAQKILEADIKQRAWYKAVVDRADMLWARTNGNPIAISETMRMAARELNLEKPWMADFKRMDMRNCPACGALVNPAYPVCGNCKAIINAEKAKELNLAFAKA